jgi:hypothetical protein
MPEVQMLNYRVSVNKDQLSRVVGVDTSDFKHQGTLRDGVTPFPNRIYAEYEDKGTAELVYEKFRRQGLVCLRNWLDPEVSHQDLMESMSRAHG